MKQTLALLPSQLIGLELLEKERQRFAEMEARFIGTCLLDLGGTMDGTWKWDMKERHFYKDEE